MIRILVRPTKKRVTIIIPNDYVNKQLELLLFPIDDGIRQPNSSKDSTITLKKTKGMMKKYQVDPVKWQKQIREEYER